MIELEYLRNIVEKLPNKSGSEEEIAVEVMKIVTEVIWVKD